ncbi:MAG: B12-binding domain-containing protein [Candidatus Methanofastidiosia archaeon]
MKEKEILERLKWDVVNFNMEDIIEACRKALKAGIPPKKAVLEGMARGMDIVGERYESYQYFLPDLIMAGEVMNEGVSFLAQHLEKKRAQKEVEDSFWNCGRRCS